MSQTQNRTYIVCFYNTIQWFCQTMNRSSCRYIWILPMNIQCEDPQSKESVGYLCSEWQALPLERTSLQHSQPWDTLFWFLWEAEKYSGWLMSSTLGFSPLVLSGTRRCRTHSCYWHEIGWTATRGFEEHSFWTTANMKENTTLCHVLRFFCSLYYFVCLTVCVHVSCLPQQAHSEIIFPLLPRYLCPKVKSSSRSWEETGKTLKSGKVSTFLISLRKNTIVYTCTLKDANTSQYINSPKAMAG